MVERRALHYASNQFVGTMSTSAKVSLSPCGFDNEEFERALTAAAFDRCRELVESADGLDAVLARARLAMRERRYLDVIGSLSDFPKDSTTGRVARDVLLGAALGMTRDYSGGRRLIERALQSLTPGDRWYEEALYYKAAIAWMKQEYREAEETSEALLGSLDPNNRARARILLSWVALRRGEVLRQVDELQKALDELDTAEMPDQYFRANALFTLALLCSELPLREIADRVRNVFESLPWTSGLQLERFQITRFLAAIDELEGNELAAFSGFRKAALLSPSAHWSVLCFLDRALLAKCTGEMAFAAEQVQEAHDLAQRLSWNDVTGEERSALLVLATLFAGSDPAVAEQYLARFRTLTTSVIPILSYGTDPRVKGFETYSQGVAWLGLGDLDEARAALTEAWSIFEEFDYGWRAALCALALYEVTHDRRWVQRAAVKIDPWPQSWIARRVAEAANGSVLRLDRVPPAKREVLELVRAGRRNSEIAKQLGRSPNTVRNQLSQLFQTFNVKSRAELVAVLSKPVVPLNALQHRRHLN
jgi:DNA-binding CsgD family transcriptional regulator